MAKQKPCQKEGRNKRSDAAKAATAARKLQSAKAAYAAKLNSRAFQKAVKQFNWVAPIEHPVMLEEVIQCQKALDNFLALAKNTISEEQLIAAQNWVLTVEAKNFNSKKQQEILTLANTDVEEARLAAHKLYKEFKAAKASMPKPNYIGTITFGVPSSVKRANEYKMLKAKKQKPILKAKASNSNNGVGFAPKSQKKETSVITVINQVEEPITAVEELIAKAAKKVADLEFESTLTKAEAELQAAYKEAYEAQLQCLKQFYQDSIAYEKQQNQERLDELKRQKQEAIQKAYDDAKRDFQLSLLPEQKKEKSTAKVNPELKKAQKLMRAAIALKGKDKELDKRINALSKAVANNSSNLKKKFDFALSRFKLVKKTVEVAA